MKKEIIILDGDSNGFAIYHLPTRSYISNKNGIALFRNIELAKNYAIRVKHMLNPFDYEFHICLGGSMIPYDYFEMVNGNYQLYAENKGVATKYFVQPIVRRAVSRVGYFVFNNGTRENDKTLGFAKSNEYFRSVQTILYAIAKVPANNPGLVSVIKDQYGLCASLKNSTAKLHVCYNSNIMNINQMRKGNGLQVLRFDKTMDKFSTLYSFIDIDISEPNWMNGIEELESIIPIIVSNVAEIAETSCEYKPVELFKSLILED